MNNKKNRYLKYIKPYMNRNYDKGIHISVLLLLAIGFLMILSVSVGESSSLNGLTSDSGDFGSVIGTASVIKTFIKQLFSVVISYYVMTLLSKVFTFSAFNKYHKLICAGFSVLLFATLFFYNPSAGAASWLNIGPISIQPSEFAKILSIVLIGLYIEKTRNKSNITTIDIIKVPLILIGFWFVIIFLQPDIGTLLIIVLIIMLSVVIATHPKLRNLQLITYFGFVLLGILLFFCMTEVGLDILDKAGLLTGFRADRFRAILDPTANASTSNYQLLTSLYIFASTGFIGNGIGGSIQKFGHLPAADTDYIMAILVEEIGYIGLFVVFFLYGYIMYKLFKYAVKSKSEGHKIVYVGTIVYMFIHFTFNIGGITGLIPLTGIPFLFISSGGSSLLAIMIAIGICQAFISREVSQGAVKKRNKPIEING